jgi:hypothetical protein
MAAGVVVYEVNATLAETLVDAYCRPCSAAAPPPPTPLPICPLREAAARARPDWLDEHIPQILRLDGFRSAQRSAPQRRSAAVGVADAD